MSDTPAIVPPAALPQENARFIAYGPEQRVADPQGGDPITARPQVYVRYYRDMKVKEVKVGGRSGGDTVAVHFDPESVGLKEPITAYLDPSDPLVAYIQSCGPDHAHDVALESVRRVKGKSSKAPISPLIPIHALRGAEHPNGTAGKGADMMGASAENIRNLLAMVDGRPGKDLSSNPYEWASLINNTEGYLPPEGWVYYGAAGDQWAACGTIVPSKDAAPKAGAGIPADLGALVEQIAAAVAEKLQPSYGRPLPKDRFDEGKPWQVRTNDGRINLGSYPATSAQRVARVLLTGGENEDTLWETVEQVLAEADKAQCDAYGRGVTPDRSSASHREAVDWVLLARDAGVENPVAFATAHMQAAGRSVAATLTKDKGKPTEKATNSTDAATDDALVQSLLPAIAAAWNDPAALAALGTQVAERGIDPVISMGGDDTNPVFAHPANEADPHGPVLGLLRHRHGILTNGQPSQAAAPAPEAAQPAPQAPQAAVSPPPATAPAGAGGETVDGLFAEVADAWWTASPVDALFARAKAANLLTANVKVTFNDAGPVLDPQGTDMMLGAVIAKATEHANATASGTPAPAPAAAAPAAPAPSDAAADALARAKTNTPAPAAAGRSAQAIADDASAVLASGAPDRAARIDTLVAEAAPMDSVEVKVEGMVGPLGSFLRSVQRRASV